MGPSPDDSGVVPLGSVLDGRYRVDAVLGKGGMGRVYKGEHTGIGRAVAIKVLHPDLGRNKEAAARFQREALASGRLDHPNIVGVSDFGVMEDGSLYLVMEALEGEGLGARLERERRVPWPDAADIMRQVLAGLRHAHDKGVVHRDIKPDNIFLANKDGERIVKILDFGIAKLYAGSGDDPAMTRAGLTVGTPAYLSPEQAVGGEIKPASDLYSLSVVFYEALAGRAPFEDKDPLQIMTAHVSRDVPSFAEVAPDLRVPPALETLIRKGLEKMQADRFASANEYLAALDNVLRDAGIAIAPRGSGSVSIPPTMTPTHGSPIATPMPFSSRSGTSAPTSAFTPAPFPRRSLEVRAATDPSGAHEPIPKKWLWIAGIVFGLAIAIAIALKVNGGSAPAKPQPRARHSEAAPPPTTPPPAAAKPATAPAEASAPAGSAAPVDATLERDTELKAALHDLEDSTTCTDRRAAIAKLVALGDQRAILPLRRARYRMEGGVLGFNEHNSNACLKADAEAAIKALGGTIR
jgi:serine/threonine-protein kinase